MLYFGVNLVELNLLVKVWEVVPPFLVASLIRLRKQRILKSG